MNVLWPFAHPDPRSLNGELKDAGVAALERVRGRGPDLGPRGVHGHDDLVLRDHLAPGRAGLGVHLRDRPTETER